MVTLLVGYYFGLYNFTNFFDSPFTEMACNINIEPITAPLQLTSPIQATSPKQANSVPETPKMLPSVVNSSSIDSKITYVDETQHLTDEEPEENTKIDAEKAIEKGKFFYAVT